MTGTRIGIDENGLGSHLGPLVVTSVSAQITGRNSGRRPTRSADESSEFVATSAFLDDSKRLVSHHDVRLGEAWTRVLVGPEARSPGALVHALSLYPLEELQEPCPSHVRSQCWEGRNEGFEASDDLMRSVTDMRERLAEAGLRVTQVFSALHCTRRLNQELARGNHRFLVDLHAMERLILAHHAQVKHRVVAVCGKVGGMRDYPKFFGPLGGRLHTVVEQEPSRSVYDFPGLGELRFEQDADARDPLVMIASLVGKYLRELFMARIASRYFDEATPANRPSGYHDKVTQAFVSSTELLRKQRRVPFDCFERKRAQ
ncbi:MAG: hypothetical protein QM784_25150 [Polyangiaceae bacterium]